ncbi:hypothetical protein Trydic_g7068 [Trypoxylus dichotomus]
MRGRGVPCCDHPGDGAYLDHLRQFSLRLRAAISGDNICNLDHAHTSRIIIYVRMGCVTPFLEGFAAYLLQRCGPFSTPKLTTSTLSVAVWFRI